jgi:hypothetical protein
MKINVIKKASTTKKPQNYCPWVSDDCVQPTDKK